MRPLIRPKVSVASGKGGTGKTFLSTNLASYTAEKERTVLADLDVEEPNSGLFIKGSPVLSEDKFKMIPEWNSDKCILCGKCQRICNFNSIIKMKDSIMTFPQLCHSCYACSELCPEGALPMQKHKVGVLNHYRKENLEFIESKLNIGEEQAVSLISQTNDYTTTHLKNIISFFDCPPGTACPTIEATKNSDLVILISEPTPFGLHDLRLIVKAMKSIEKRIAVVINRYGTGNDDIIDYCRKESLDIIAKIPDSRKVSELYSSGQLVFDKIAEVRRELDKIYRYIKTEVSQ